MSLKSLFWNEKENRARLLLRLALLGILWALGYQVVNLVSIIPAAIFRYPPGASLLMIFDPGFRDALLDIVFDFPLLLLFRRVIQCPSFPVILWIAARWIDRRPMSDYGLRLSRRWWENLGFGMAIGALLMFLVFVVEVSAGWITILPGGSAPGSGNDSSYLLGFAWFAKVAMEEETGSRGYLLRNLAESMKLPALSGQRAFLLAYLLSSVVFSLFHLNNPNVTALAIVNLIFLGFLFGLGFVLTGDLSMSIGLHLAWNFFQGHIFGFPVSGMMSTPAMITLQQNGPALWSGGDFGPEGGLIGTLAVLLGCASIALWSRWRAGSASWNDLLMAGSKSEYTDR